MTEFDFFIGTFPDAVEQLSRWLDSRPVNNLLHFNSDAGKGSVLISQLEAGCFVRAWNYTLKEDTKFRICSSRREHPSIFMVNYLLMPESFLIETGKEWSQKIRKVNELNNVVFSTNHSEFSFIVKAGKQAKALDICFTREWLFDQFSAEVNKKLQHELETPGDQKPFLVRTFSIDDYRLLSEIIEKIANNTWHNIFLKSRVLTLLSTLMDNVLGDGQKAATTRYGANTAAIVSIEKKITSLLHEKFPTLKDLAKEFSFSESTLKRQFKQAYGKSIYEYYLDKKMSLAKMMIVEKNMTTSQVAYSLGYEKASPFIKIFKRIHGVSPGSLRSKNNTNEPAGE